MMPDGLAPTQPESKIESPERILIWFLTAFFQDPAYVPSTDLRASSTMRSSIQRQAADFVREHRSQYLEQAYQNLVENKAGLTRWQRSKLFFGRVGWIRRRLNLVKKKATELFLAEVDSLKIHDTAAQETPTPMQKLFAQVLEAVNDPSQVDNYLSSSRPQLIKFYTARIREIASRVECQAQTPDEKTLVQILASCQAETRVYYTESFLEQNEDQLDIYTRIGYAPGGDQELLDKLEEQAYVAPDILAANEDSEKSKLIYLRSRSKFRAIVGKVPYAIENKLVVIPMITACAPNFMGTSPSDILEYTTDKAPIKIGAEISGNRDLDQENYSKVCLEQAELILGAAQADSLEKGAGSNPTVYLADFGLGIYLRRLNPKAQAEARDIMRAAFARVALEKGVNVSWIIWNQRRDSAQEVAAINKKHRNQNFSAQAGDIIADLAKFKAATPNLYVVNNGSDRTIGGRFSDCESNGRYSTTEEAVAVNSLLLLLHSIFNPVLKEAFSSLAKFKATAKLIKLPSTIFRPQGEATPTSVSTHHPTLRNLSDLATTGNGVQPSNFMPASFRRSMEG